VLDPQPAGGTTNPPRCSTLDRWRHAIPPCAQPWIGGGIRARPARNPEPARRQPGARAVHNPWTCRPHHKSAQVLDPRPVGAASGPALRATLDLPAPTRSPRRAQPLDLSAAPRTCPVLDPGPIGRTASLPCARRATYRERTAACPVHVWTGCAHASPACRRAESPDLSARSRARAAPLRHAPGRP
jgi:hypothetical protein